MLISMNPRIAQEPNLEALLSILTESLDRAKLSRDANFSLLTNYARVLSSILTQFHAYKQRHIADVSAWHRSYRAQLADARAENERLREQIWDMQEHAGRANALLRDFRRSYFDDENQGLDQSQSQSQSQGKKDEHGKVGEAGGEKDAADDNGDEKKQTTASKNSSTRSSTTKKNRPSTRWNRRIDAIAQRQELRFWRRMALPELEDDDAFWSDDDDLIDPAEKERLSEVERKVAEQALAGVGGSAGSAGGSSGDEDEDEEGEEGDEGEGDADMAERDASVSGSASDTGSVIPVGGVAMQRDSSSSPGPGAGVRETPAPPPRPASTGSTGGRT